MTTDTARPAVATGTLRGADLTILPVPCGYILSLNRSPWSVCLSVTRGDMMTLATISPESWPAGPGILADIRTMLLHITRPPRPSEQLTGWHAALARCAREALATEAEASRAAGAAWYTALARQAADEREGGPS